MRPTPLIVLGVLGVIVTPQVISAELIVFPSGRSLSARSHRIEGGSIVIELRNGGEVVCDLALVQRIVPDEVPYPDPVDVRPVSTSDAQPAYSALIDELAAVQGVDGNLIRAMVQVESGYRQHARSSKGAMGLMQLMPETARRYAVSNPYDPRANIEGGIKHLKTLLQRYELPSALAAYNAGEAAVLRFGGVPPFRETRGYVRQILKLIGR